MCRWIIKETDLNIKEETSMKFKKLAALTLAGAMSLSLAACGGGGDTASPAPNTGSPCR